MGAAPNQASGHARLVQLASWLVPRDEREEFRAEWMAELTAWEADGRDGLRRHASGAFADAFWLRQRRIADVTWIDDLRHGWRQLREHSGFALTAIGILTIGMASSITAFGVVSQVLLRPLPYPDADRVVTIWERNAAEDGRLDVAPGNFVDWRERATSFVTLAGAEPYSRDYTDGDRPEVWRAANVTEGFFESLGVQPQTGRLFRDDEYVEGRNRVVMLSATLWRSRFAADPGIVGRRVTLDGEPYEVVGVMPDDFLPLLLEDVPGEIAVWSPKVIEEFEPGIRASGYWQVVGRLKPGTPVAQAQAEMDRIAAQLSAEHPATNRDSRAEVVGIREHLIGDARPVVALFTAAVIIVLLISCVNVTNLILARGATRSHEIAVRTALGASRWRLIGQLLTESLLLAGIAVVPSVALAVAATRALARLGPREIPWLGDLHVDGSAMAFAAGLSVVVAVAAGLVPALRLAGEGLAASTRRTASADRTQRRARAVLVAAEVALALVLVSGAALLLRSFVNLVNVETGFARHGVAVLQLFAWDRNPGPDRLRAFYDDAIARIGGVPGVEAAGAVSAMPFIEANIDVRAVLQIAGDPPSAPGTEPRASVNLATPGYFDVMRIPVIRGRGLTASDGPSRPGVAVISEALAERYWRGRDPVGTRVAFRLRGRTTEVEIVGVTGAQRHERLDEAPRAELILPFAQAPSGSMTVVARTTADPRVLVETAKHEIWAIDPLQTFHRTATLADLVARTVSARRFALLVLTAFAAIALVLAAAGLYGVLSAIAAQYRREIGVRVAVGARWIDILRLVMARGLTVLLVGLVVGVVGAVGAGRLLSGFLFSVAPADPLALGGAALLLLLVAVPACLVPASRAANANPGEVLRAE